MQGARAMAIAMLIPGMAIAGDAPPDTDWHRCDTDADCVLVPGICNDAAVNRAYQGVSIQYYREQAKKTHCPQNFWTPKPDLARCRLQACEATIK